VFRQLRKLFLILFFALALVYNAHAQGDNNPIGARQAGMGRSSVALTDFWNIQNNQAGISLIDKTSVGIYYENSFNVSELSTKSIAAMVPSKIGVFGVTFNHFGYAQYNEMKAGLVYARSFGQYFRIGLQLDYLQTTIGDNYGSAGNVTFEIGVQSDVSEKLTIGAWVFNPVQVKLSGNTSQKYPAIFRFGAAWDILENFIATAEVEKNSQFDPILFRGGLEYGLDEKFFFRAGFSTQQEIFSMGFGLKLKGFKFDISAVMHQSLGFSEQVSLIYQF
jgi:hypothetical protein